MLDTIGEALGAAFQTIASTIYWIGARIFGLTTGDKTPGWAKLLAAIVIFGIMTLLTYLLWAWIAAAIILLAIGGIIVAFLFGS
jgi:hypothetical protein